MHPTVNSNAQTVSPDEDAETFSSAAAWITFAPKATPTFGRHERTPARIAITNPALKVLELPAEALWANGALREPPIEHTTMPRITRTVPSTTNTLSAGGIGGAKNSSGIIAPRPAISPMMMGYPNAIPSLSIPRPNRTAPRPQPRPNKPSTIRSFVGEVAYTAKIRGTSRRMMIQFKTNMPSREKVAQVCSHDQPSAIIMGQMKLP